MIGEIHFLFTITAPALRMQLKRYLVKVGEYSGLLPQTWYFLSPAACAAGPAALYCPGCSGQC